MKQISPQSKSFIVLFCVVVVGTYVCLALWSSIAGTSSGDSQYADLRHQTRSTKDATPTPTPAQEIIPQVDTSSWKSYNDPKEHLSFLYKPGWKIIAPKTASDFTILQIDPGAKYYNIKIYISPKEFYAMEGLPTKTETISGKQALNVSNALYGISADNLYYTFDVGLSMSLVPDFNALVHSVKFDN